MAISQTSACPGFELLVSFRAHTRSLVVGELIVACPIHTPLVHGAVIALHCCLSACCVEVKQFLSSDAGEI